MEKGKNHMILLTWDIKQATDEQMQQTHTDTNSTVATGGKHREGKAGRTHGDCRLGCGW